MPLGLRGAIGSLPGAARAACSIHAPGSGLAGELAQASRPSASSKSETPKESRMSWPVFIRRSRKATGRSRPRKAASKSPPTSQPASVSAGKWTPKYGREMEMSRMSRPRVIVTQPLRVQAASRPQMAREVWACPDGSPKDVSALSARILLLTQYGRGSPKAIFKASFRPPLTKRISPMRIPSPTSKHHRNNGRTSR